MIYRILILCTVIVLGSFCKSPKPSEKMSTNTTAASEITTQQPSKNNTVIRAIRFQNGKNEGLNIDPEQTDAIISTALMLLTNAEPMRIALDAEQIAELRANATGFELFFAPPLGTDIDASGLSKMLFLTSGNFSNNAQIPDARFFIALDNDKQYIGSPYVADGAADKVTLLQQLISGHK